MLLAVDIGNTNIKFGIFDGEKLLSKFSFPTSNEISVGVLKSLIGDRRSITNAMVCSVVPEKTSALKNALHETFGFEALIVTNDLDFGLKINYQPLSSLGNDRIVNSFSAAEKYGTPCIVCSIGTAATFDVINKNRELIGGVIAPGMKTMAKALHLNTAKLPEVEIQKPENIIGITTVASIQSGIFYGHVAMVEGMIEKIKSEIGGDANVVATGGFSHLIAKHTKHINIVDENLLLDGLRLLNGRIGQVDGSK